MAVVGTEEIELEVLAALARNALAEDDDPLGAAPGLDVEARREGVDRAVHALPAAPRGDARAHAEPLPHRDLHGVLDAGGREDVENGLVEEGAIESHFERNAAQALAHVGEQRDETLGRADRVVHVARPIPHPEELAGLREMRRQRVVRRVLRMVRAEATLGAIDALAAAQHRAVELDRGAREGDLLARSIRHVAQQIVQPLLVGRDHVLQSARERSLIGKSAQARETQEQRISIEHPQVREPAATEQEHAHHDQRRAERAVVPYRSSDGRTRPASDRAIPLAHRSDGTARVPHDSSAARP